MKKTIFYLLTLLIFTFVFCSSNQKLFFETDIKPIDEKHNIEQGFLYFEENKKRKVPDIFYYIFSAEESYRFITREKAFGKEGYFPADGIKIQETNKIISNHQLKRGYYKGKLRLKNTPTDWLYGVCSNGAYFFSIKGMYRLIKKEQPETLKRHTFSE